MYFVAMTIRLQLMGGSRPLSVADGVYAHAAIHRAITAQDAEVGKALHDMRVGKRLTLAIIRSDAYTAVLRIAFMAADGPTYARLLIVALAAQPIVRLGARPCRVEAVSLDTPGWCGIGTWADLTHEKAGRFMHFAFETPTAITKNDGRGRRFTSVFPMPSDLFAGLERRWRMLDGPPLPRDLGQFTQAGGCLVSRYDLHTVMFRTVDRTQVGFTGSVMFECLPDRTYISALNALARLAYFSGVGYQTARGMGMVRTTISNEVPT